MLDPKEVEQSLAAGGGEMPIGKASEVGGGAMAGQEDEDMGGDMSKEAEGDPQGNAKGKFNLYVPIKGNSPKGRGSKKSAEE